MPHDPSVPVKVSALLSSPGMATFNLNKIDQFAGSSATIRRPREFSYFSYDDQHQLKALSDESLAYYYPPYFDVPGLKEPFVDLRIGFDSFVQRDDTVDEHLDGLLDTLQAHEEALLEKAMNGEGEVADVRTKADVITWRGMMTKILTAIFDDLNDFSMNATCFQGTIFIEEDHSHKNAGRQEQYQRPPRRGEMSQEMMQYLGYKFETLSVLKRPWAETTRDEIDSRDSQTVNNHAQYCSIVRTGIGKTSLVIAGEVDAVLGSKPDNPDSPIPWIELKTTAEFDQTLRDLVKFERKLLKFWAQSFLLGVPTIVVGLRTREGRLARIMDLQTQRIPGQVKNGQRTWDGNMCINFTAAFLEFLKGVIVGDGVWRIARKRGANVIEVVKIMDEGSGKILKASFKEHRERLRALEVSQALAS